jgi:glyoxylate reductase
MRRKAARRPLVFVAREIEPAPLRELARAARIDLWTAEMPPSAAELRRRLRDADGALTMLTERIDANAIGRARRLRVVSNLAVGVDNIDLEAATRAGIAVGHTPGILTETTADLAWALMMAVARRVTEGDRYVRAGKWRTWGPRTMLGTDIHGATLGIIGWGAIGRAVARRASGFGMRVLYAAHRSKRAPLRSALRDGETPPKASRVTLERLLRESDFVSLHVPLTPATRRIIDSSALRKMKPGAILINTARGPVVDQHALVKALESGRLGGAGLDVTDPEPISIRDPLLRFDNVVITPHIGSASKATRERMGEIAVRNITAVLDGRMPPYCANTTVRLRPR